MSDNCQDGFFPYLYPTEVPHYRTKQIQIRNIFKEEGASSVHMDKAKKNQRSYRLSFRAKSAMEQLKNSFMAKSAMKQLQNSFISIFRWQTQVDRRMRRIENSRPLKSGHFSVVVLKNGEPKKLFVSLKYLTYPPFIKLLDAAAEEYGFNQKGTLVIPVKKVNLKNLYHKSIEVINSHWQSKDIILQVQNSLSTGAALV